MHDLKFAFRQLLKNPGFTAVAVLTLTLGIGSNTAIFSFVNAILLRPLPYKDAKRLVIIYENYAANGWFKNAVAAPMLDVWRKQCTVFEGLGARAYSGISLSLTSLGPPEILTGWRVSANVFGLLATAILAPIAATLIQAAISRSREFAADQGGAEIAGAPDALARALRKIDAISHHVALPANPATAHLFIVKPFSGQALFNLFSTHPPTEQRIERLLGQKRQEGK